MSDRNDTLLERPLVNDGSPLGRAVSALNALGSIGILLLMVLINSDILGRTVFDAPIAGVAEMVSFSIVGIVFLQLAHTLRSGSMTRSEVLLNVLETRWPRAHALFLLLFNLTGAALLLIVLIYFWPSLAKAYSHPERHFMGNPGFFTVPHWPLYTLMVIGMTATMIQFLASAFGDLRRLSERPGLSQDDTP